MNWQPIETVPVDMEVLVYCPYVGPTNEERIELVVAHNTRTGSHHAWATHWMMLPVPPDDGAV
jgi:hypothetical protein